MHRLQAVHLRIRSLTDFEPGGGDGIAAPFPSAVSADETRADETVPNKKALLFRLTTCLPSPQSQTGPSPA